MLDLSLKWSGKLTDAKVMLGMARGLERQSGLADEFSCGDQGGEMEDGRPVTGLSDMLQGVFITKQEDLYSTSTVQSIWQLFYPPSPLSPWSGAHLR